MDSLVPIQDHWPAASASPSSAPAGAAGVDVLAILKRHFLLVIACTVVGGGLGILNYVRTPPTYQSTAEVLVENERSTTFSNEMMYGYPSNEKTIDTHVLVIQSPLIVGAAVKKLDLSKYPALPNDPNNRAAAIRPIRAKLQVEKEGDWSNVMSLTYQSSDARECGDVLASLVAEYEAFLSDSSEDVGQETTDLIAKAKEDLIVELEKKQAVYDSFREKAPLIWKDGKGVNPHRERQMEVEKKRSELLVESSTLRAKLKNTVDALRSGGERRKAVYFEAIREITPDSKIYGGAAALPQRQFMAALTDEYAKLKADEQSLATRFGEGHPDLMDIRNRLQSLQTTLGLSDNNEAIYGGDGIPVRPDEIDYVAIYVNMLNDRLATIEEQAAELDRIYEVEKQEADATQSYQLQDEQFRKDLEATQRLFDAVVSRLEEINIVRDHGGDSIDILAPPEKGMQVAPVAINNLLVGGLLGMLSGCGFGFLLDRSAAIFRSPLEIRKALQVPVIGRIPVIERKDSQPLEEFAGISTMLCTVHRHGSSLSEAYRAVRTSLFYSMAGNNHRLIQVTSPLPGDGKSTLIANLAVTIAQSGKRVLLVDADFRRPTLHQLFGVESLRSGLVSVVRGEVDARDATIKTEIPNLFLLPVAERAQNPAELLTKPEFKSFLEQMRAEYEFVLVDTPPLLAVTDPSAVAAQVDGVILVLRIRRGVQIAAVRAREMLADVDANVLGAVVNAVDEKSGYGKYGMGYGYGYRNGYGYGYGYGYTTEEDVSKTPSPHPGKAKSRHLTVGLSD